MNKEPLYIIKIGGNVLDNPGALTQFLQQFAALKANKILVHGGGKIATRIGEQLGITANYTNGRRITDAATIDLVTMVYGGLVNKQLVAQLQAMGCNATGLTGADGNLLPAVKRPVKTIDYGFAGDIQQAGIPVNSWQSLLTSGMIPVMAPLTHDGAGQLLNTNADTIASAIAVSLSSLYTVRLIYCFEKKGVLADINDENSAIPLITQEIYQQLLSGGKLADGILPKIDNAFAAIANGVAEVLVGDAGDLNANCSGAVKGTLFR